MKSGNAYDKGNLSAEFFGRSERAQAVEKYFQTDKWLHEAADKIRQDIIEGGMGWTTFSPHIRGAALSQRFGGHLADTDYLATMEKKLKGMFPMVNHLRFEIEHSFPTVMIDTKPLTWWRKKFVHPERTGGFG